MKKVLLIIAFVLPSLLLSYAQTSTLSTTDYDSFFTKERLRIDLTFAGDAKKQSIFLGGLHKEALWSGSRTNLVYPFNYGEYQYKLFDSTGRVIFSKGFSTLFQEWRTTAESKTTPRAFASSYWIPFPKVIVKVVFYERVKSTGLFSEIFSYNIDPKDKAINEEKENDFNVTPVMVSGDPAKKVDLVFIAEGYTAEQIGKFKADAAKFAGYLFNFEPYKSRKEDFNIWAVESISKESGTDIPHMGIWKNTIASSNFYTFQIDRYLTAPDQREIASLASNSTCDAIYVIVNTNKYGGGGIYNFYGLSMSDHPTEASVFVHEFGHSFAGLGDEYYSSAVAYEEFYNLKTEPWEPNLTTQVNFDSKWKDMMGKDGVGLYEGGGYMTKGIFRPWPDCRMKTNSAPGFCPVCTKAISDMIDYYTK